MKFLWQALNFQIFLDVKYRAAALEVFPNTKKIIEKKTPISIAILPLSPKNIAFAAKKTPLKRLHSGLWGGKHLHFFHYIKQPLHPPALLSTILMQLVKTIGLRFNVALLHSACVVMYGKAVIIPGREGRGKTTLAKLLPGRILNDDLSLIAQNESGNFEVYRVPTHQDLASPNPFTWEGPFVLERLIFLRRDNPRGIEVLHYRSAKKHLLEEGPFLEFPESEKERDAYRNLLQTFFEAMLKKTPCFCLSYDPKKKLNFLNSSFFPAI
jgi:hypothetical protein